MIDKRFFKWLRSNRTKKHMQKLRDYLAKNPTGSQSETCKHILYVICVSGKCPKTLLGRPKAEV